MRARKIVGAGDSANDAHFQMSEEVHFISSGEGHQGAYCAQDAAVHNSFSATGLQHKREQQRHKRQKPHYHNERCTCKAARCTEVTTSPQWNAAKQSIL